MGQVRLGDLTDLQERGWLVDLQALLTERTMKSLDKRIGPSRQLHRLRP
jgi:hypothetical protein